MAEARKPLRRLCENHYLDDFYFPYGAGGDMRHLYVDDEGRVFALSKKEAEARNEAPASQELEPITYTFFHDDGPILLTEKELVNDYMRLREQLQECEAGFAELEAGMSARHEFLEASVEVWREIDRLTEYGGGSYPGIPMSTDLRQREREAWERYREVLDG